MKVEQEGACCNLDKSTGQREVDRGMDETAAVRLSRPVGLGNRRNRGGPPAEMIAAEENKQRCSVTNACLP